MAPARKTVPGSVPAGAVAERSRLACFLTRGTTAAGLAILALFAAPAAADCFDFGQAGAEVSRGTITGLPPGRIEWRVGEIMAGHHKQGAIEISWRAANGNVVRQSLFNEMLDSGPTVARQGNRILVRPGYCQQGGRRCRFEILLFAWDRNTEQFLGVNRRARQASDESSCPVTEAPA